MTRHTKLIEKARQNTGLDDFGEDSFIDGLERLLWAADHEAALTAIGTSALDDQIIDILSQRLEVEQCLRTNPEIEKQEIKAPLIGLGLPRTGSTAFSYLLAEDSNVRCLRHWQLYKLCPPPEAATQYLTPGLQNPKRC